MTDLDILSVFRKIKPDRLINQFQDWILFFLLTFFFWAVVTIALKKRFGDSKAFRVLATSTALMLSIGTYYLIHIRKLNLSLEGLGMFGGVLILIIIFFVLFSLNKSFGMRTRLALPLGFVLFYISLVRLTPNIMTDFQSVFPLAKLTMAVLFFISLYYLIKAFISHLKPDLKETAKEIKDIKSPVKDEPEIEHEIHEDKKEDKLLKGKTLKLTKFEIHTIDDMENILEHLISLIKSKGSGVTQEEGLEISKLLQKINENENVLLRAMPTLKHHAEIFKSKHRKDISELEKRHSESKDNPKQQKAIEEELKYQKQMIELLNFIESYESKIVSFTQTFNQTIAKAMQRLKSLYPHDCLEYLEYSKKGLSEMKHIFKKQKELEEYVIKLNKKTIKDLKREKNPK